MKEALKYTKLPVTIEAVELTPENAHDLAKWCGGEVKFGDYKLTTIVCIDLKTLESGNSTQRADMGDYIIKGVKGEFYPCKPDIFALTYKRAQ